MNTERFPHKEFAKKTLWTFLFLVYSGLVFYFAVRPIKEGAPVIGIQGMDKLIHACEFTLYVLLGYRAIKYYIERKKVIYVLVLISVTYGSLTELSQLFFSYRTASSLDWLANLTGILAGLIILNLYRKGELINVGSG